MMVVVAVVSNDSATEDSKLNYFKDVGYSSD
jgi:hypothetical protein